MSAKKNSLPRVQPATDILEKEDGFHIFMDVPGVKKDELALEINENELVISGRAVHPLEEDRNHVAMEFASCEYMRTFTLSDTVDRERIKAMLHNGVLEVWLPRKEKELPKRIEIQAG